MAYEYYEKLLSHTKECYSKGLITNKKLLEQLEGVYRKARAFDEILKIDNQATDEDRITGQYESDIETVLSEYKENE